MLNSFWKKNEPLLMAALTSLVETTEDVDIQEKLRPAIAALEVNKRREKDKTHYEFDGKSANGKFALLRTVIPCLIKQGVKPCEISSDYRNTLKVFMNKSQSCVYKTIKNTLEQNNTEMTCPSEEELYDAQKIVNSQAPLVLDNNDYQNWWQQKGKQKEIYKEEDGIRILSQWGYDTIDYFIYVFSLVSLNLC